ncbi:hypothetical protein OG594_46750 [Streptomyces sp. NBC_01214]|uniref:hypothetical protein n=1 Tax=Streptomyces sp. NBC_01214 TaxID=2903777 RepID=UPI002251039C|nr:hypothetical protein [Streptomyces sp. NBC_01214]MCX4808956.1 hypothetical protein [Streptomyces sp. NBC_01214]
MMNLETTTNAERADNGSQLAALFIERAAAAGATLAHGDRAEIGRAMVDAYYEGAEVPPGYEWESLALVISDLFHHADGLISPVGLMHVAVSELRATVNVVPLLCGIGEEGQPGLIAGAVTAILAHAETGEICIDHLTDMAFAAWSEEVEEERFIQAKAARAARFTS